MIVCAVCGEPPVPTNVPLRPGADCLCSRLCLHRAKALDFKAPPTTWSFVMTTCSAQVFPRPSGLWSTPLVGGRPRASVRVSRKIFLKALEFERADYDLSKVLES